MDLNRTKILKDVRMAVSVGAFDGLHEGHLSILRRVKELADSGRMESMVITFDRNPKMAAKSIEYFDQLITDRQRDELLASLGIDHLAVIDFCPEFSKLTGEEFLALISGFCRLKAMVVGEDFRCGVPASSVGSVQLQEHLNRLSPGSFVEIPPFVLTKNGEIISSSLVRKKLLEGALEGVQSMLGRPYTLDLVSCTPISTAEGLLYRTESFSQLLPKEGVYDATLAYADSNEVDLVARVTAEGVLLSGMAELNAEGILCLSIHAKGSRT
jgi:riboflavin kinase/FMN adenylyltransferase